VSGIKLWFIIPSGSIRLFQEGEMVKVWPTHPSSLNACPGASELFVGTPESAASPSSGEGDETEDDKWYFPEGGTLIEIDPFDPYILLGQHLSGIHTIQKVTPGLIMLAH